MLTCSHRRWECQTCSHSLDIRRSWRRSSRLSLCRTRIAPCFHCTGQPPNQERQNVIKSLQLNRDSCLWEFTNILSLKARGLTSLSSKETIPVSSFPFVQEVFANTVFVAVVPGKEMMVNWNQTKSPPHKDTKKFIGQKFTIFAVLPFLFQDPYPRNRTPFWTPIQEEVKLGSPSYLYLVNWYTVIHGASSSAVLQCHEVVLVSWQNTVSNLNSEWGERTE